MVSISTLNHITQKLDTSSPPSWRRGRAGVWSAGRRSRRRAGWPAGWVWSGQIWARLTGWSFRCPSPARQEEREAWKQQQGVSINHLITCSERVRASCSSALYLQGIEDLHQAVVFSHVCPLKVVVFLPGVLGGALPLRGGHLLDACQAAWAVRLGQVLTRRAQDPKGSIDCDQRMHATPSDLTLCLADLVTN